MQSRRLVLIVIVVLAASCDRSNLPAVPSFDQLGFNDAPQVVHDQVLRVYERWQAKPLDAERNGQLGMNLSVYGKNAAAEILFRRARALAPMEFRWVYYQAVTLVEMGRRDEASEVFRAALMVKPGHVSSRLQLAALLMQNDDLAESAELYKAITVEFPARVEGWLGLGKIYSRLGDTDQAITALQRARLIGPQYGEVHYALASGLRAAGDKAGAARELAAYERTAQNTIRVNEPLLRQVAALHAGDAPHMAKANAFWQQARYQEAADSFRVALAINPSNADAWIGLLSVQSQSGDLSAAGNTYREAIAAGIQYARLHLVYGLVHLSAGQPDAARQPIGAALALDPQYAEAYMAMGDIEMLSGAYGDAISQYRLSVAARPNDLVARRSLALAYNAAGLFTDALGQLELLVGGNAVDDWLALRELAVAYRGVDRIADATDTLQRSREAAAHARDVAGLESIDALRDEWQTEN